MRSKKNFFKTKQFYTRNKKTIKISLISIVTIIFLISTSYLINVNIKLLFDNETHITISPSITSITTLDKTPPNITFSTTIQKLPTCEIICEATLQDTSYNKTINTTTITKTSLEKYSLPLPTKGTGQVIFNYNVNCQTTTKRFCPSKNKTYQKTAFVTVNYGLSEEETEQKEQAYEELINITTNIAILKEEIHQLLFYEKQLQEKINETINNMYVENKLVTITNKEQKAIDLWKAQAYAAIKEQNKYINEALTTITEEAKKINATIQSQQQTYNQQNLVINNIYNQENNSNWTTLLQVEPTYYSIITKTKQLYEQVINEKITLEERNTIINNITTNINQSKQWYKELLTEKEHEEKNITATYKPILESYNYTWETFDCQTIPTLINNLNNINITPIIEYNNTYCNLTTIKLFNETTINITLTKKEINITETKIPEPKATCCYKNQCNNCNETKTPIILVHGHSFSKSTSPELAFTRLEMLQQALAKEGYIDASTLNKEALIDTVPKGEWSTLPAPLVIGITYYYLNYYDIGQLSFTTRKTERIENYALRLKESISLIQEKTSQKEVIIITHSMGGLVVREYLRLFGDQDVEQVIILGTPNYGIEGDVRKYCTVTGAEEECEDMKAGSPFLQTLNNPKNQPTHTNITTIRAEGCLMKNDAGTQEQGDGVVLARNVPLPYATNKIINGSCNDLFGTELHMNFINPKLYPETYELIKKILTT